MKKINPKVYFKAFKRIVINKDSYTCLAILHSQRDTSKELVYFSDFFANEPGNFPGAFLSIQNDPSTYKDTPLGKAIRETALLFMYEIAKDEMRKRKCLSK